MKRLRRLRLDGIREILTENRLSKKELIYPMFISEKLDKPEEISSMPNQYIQSLDSILNEIEEVNKLGIPGILIFGIPKKKSLNAQEAYDDSGIVQKAIRKIKSKFDIVVATDVCLCSYTTHGHCGIIKNEEVDNDLTLNVLKKIAVSHARAGADIVAPSGMMDGMVHAIRKALDENGYKNTAIMSYSAKYASSLYAPFRYAADAKPKFGDRKTYQMNFANSNEALLEIKNDIDEGADIVMVKPAALYLDVIYRAKKKFNFPLAAYNVSGEYSMIKSGSKLGFINEREVVLELLTSIKRAGADIIITYFAKDVAKVL
ncbi:MAG: porphobilinogen synthase [Candidatus Thermoplasmatota archaeon]